MPCINPNSPEFKKALKKTGNPLLAEIEMSNLILKNQDTFYQKNNGESIEHKVSSEKTIRDLAARMSDRIGIPVKFESDRTKEYKGKLEKGVAVVNLAYATLDTPIHEIIGHPIIRAIKNKGTDLIKIDNTKYKEATVKKNFKTNRFDIISKDGEQIDSYPSLEDANKYLKIIQEIESNPNTLYQNLLKELEYGKGKEVFDRIKRDYVEKYDSKSVGFEIIDSTPIETIVYAQKNYPSKFTHLGTTFSFDKSKESYIFHVSGQIVPFSEVKQIINKYSQKYSIEDQQEEAIVELLGLYTADRLDKVKDGKLISLLKRLLKEIKSFVRDLLKQREVEIEKLPDNMTLGDIADLLAYSNSKLILPGNEVIYTTPDNQQFKTYAEASKHISDLAKSVKDVDLSNVNLHIRKKVYNVSEIPVNKFTDEFTNDDFEIKNGIWYYEGTNISVDNNVIVSAWNSNISENNQSKSDIEGFIKRNKEYEQSKEIVEEWKKVNNIQYNPEEVYSRGQEFVSVVGAYSDFDVNLMMQNLLQHIEDNQKAGGEFTISAFTKPVDKQIGHLEGGGGKIKFKIYPQSKDIKWAANTDVYSGSVWDASKKVSKDKKSELLGVSYTKYPSLSNIYSVQPNLASIIDKLAHHHNELGISLTGDNFRIEYDDDIPYSTIKIINSINSILDQKYGKLVKPEIKEKEDNINEFIVYSNGFKQGTAFKDENSSTGWSLKNESGNIKELSKKQIIKYKPKGIQPTQTNETLKESIYSIKNNNVIDLGAGNFKAVEYEGFWAIAQIYDNGAEAIVSNDGDAFDPILFYSEKGANDYIKKSKEKDYTSQALINTKIAKLKEVAKKYPRSLIRSEVKSIFSVSSSFEYLEELPFQKIPSTPVKEISDISSLSKLQGDLMESEKGQIGVNKQQLLMLLGPTMYNKPLAQVAIKELLQNSFDAIKARMNITENRETGNINITVNYDNRTISIKDDGIGMTPDIVKNAFLSIGGTNKEGLDVSERSGGFGLAKVQFLLGSEYVKVITIRDGVKTFLEATAVQLYNDDFTINKEQTNEPNGSYVEVKIPESYTTPEGAKREIDFPGKYKSDDTKYTAFDILDKPLIGNVNVSFTHVKDKQEYKKVVPIGENTTEETLPPLFSKIEFAWGSADLYMSTEKKGVPNHRILSSGIYQFNYSFRSKDFEKIPYDIVVNIKPSVSSTSEQYPFNNQRENFKNTVTEDIKSLNNYLKKYASGEAEKNAKAVFSNITGLPKVDPNKVLTSEERDKLYADVEKTIAENKKSRIEQGSESNEEVRKIWKLLIDKEGVKDAETGKVEVSNEKNYGSSFKAEKEIEKVEAVETSNFNPVLPQYHNNTNFNYLEIPRAAEFFSDFGSVVLEMVRFAGNELGYDYKKLKSEDEKFFAGVSIDKQYGGVHVRKIINAIFVNPLAFNVSSIEEAVGIALHVTIHEINHTTVSGEGANFTTALGVLYGKIYATGKYGLYEGLFRSVYKKHFETFKQLKNEYDKSSTRNLSESFSGDQIKKSPTGDVQRDVNDVSTRQSSTEGYTGNQEDNTKDKTGDVILSKFLGSNQTQSEEETLCQTPSLVSKNSIDVPFA